MKCIKLLFLAVFFSSFSNAQVGVNATEIHPSAALDIQYGTNPKGLLTPRMTTAQRIAIATPADGLIVYDTTLQSFYHYKAAITGPPASAAAWIRMSSDVSGRTNFKRIKAGDNLAVVLKEEFKTDKYELKTNTLYEINGTVVFDFPIDLNNAYIQGIDSGEDAIQSTGAIFKGSTGGTIKGLTLVSGVKVLDLNGTVSNNIKTQNLIFRDCIVANSASVGSITNFNMVFFSVVQFASNTTGIVYNNINQLLLSNLGWFGNNVGIFETYTGTFGLIQKLGGFSEVNGAAVGMDVSTNPTINNDAVMESVVFTGAPTGTGTYVKRYGIGSYTGYNFNNKWTVRCSGIPVETDAVAVGDVNLDYDYGTGTNITLTTSTAVKLAGASTSNDFFRASNGDAQTTLKYLGNKKRYFTVDAVASFRGTAPTTTPVPSIYVFYIAVNGTVIPRSKTYAFTPNATDVVSVPIQSVVELSPNDNVDVRVIRYNGNYNMLLVSLSLFMR